jgi:hypothetical protein
VVVVVVVVMVVVMVVVVIMRQQMKDAGSPRGFDNQAQGYEGHSLKQGTQRSSPPRVYSRAVPLLARTASG